MWALIPRIEAHHDSAYDAGGPTGRGRARLVVRLRDGTEQVQEIAVARTISTPLDAEGVRAKFRTLTDGIMAPERRDALVAAVAGLERAPDVRPLLRLLTDPVGSPFELPA